MGITLACLWDENLGHQYELAMGRMQGIVERQRCRTNTRLQIPADTHPRKVHRGYVGEGGGGVHTFGTQGMRRGCGIHAMGDMVHSGWADADATRAHHAGDAGDDPVSFAH